MGRRMIRPLLAALPLLVGALLVVGGGACVVSGSLFFASWEMALAGLVGLLAGLGISHTVYRWATQKDAPPPHDS